MGSFFFHIGSERFHLFIIFFRSFVGFLGVHFLRIPLHDSISTPVITQPDSLAVMRRRTLGSRLFTTLSPQFLLDLFLSTVSPPQKPQKHASVKKSTTVLKRAFVTRILPFSVNSMISYRLGPYIKCSFRDMKISNKFYQGAFIIIFCLVCKPPLMQKYIFIALKLEKAGPTLHCQVSINVHPCHPLQLQCLYIPVHINA